jgi:3-isopropylmalate/(R)-2-methylmalate dehydratase large subunit/methanogen homoaconitase large subunit
MSIDERLTLANLTVDFGGKAGLCEPDEHTRAYLGEAEVLDLHPIAPVYRSVIEVDAERLEPQIACPPAIENVQDLSAVEGTELDEVFVGSCANGRIEDLAIVAGYFKGKQVHPRTRTIVVPASKQIYMEALARGYIQTFMEAGALVMNAGCGPCLGRQHGVLGPGERALSTSNRNYAGRMGSAQAEIYLANPAVAAASALAGMIADPRRLPLPDLSKRVWELVGVRN